MISLKTGPNYYTLYLASNGWIAADMVQYLEDVLSAVNRERAILKLLGFTLQISAEKPERRSVHWVIVHLDSKQLETNSAIIRRAVDQAPPDDDWPVAAGVLERIHTVLDRHDFTVKLY